MTQKEEKARQVRILQSVVLTTYFEKMGISQRKLSQRANISTSQLNGILNSKRRLKIKDIIDLSEVIPELRIDTFFYRVADAIQYIDILSQEIRVPFDARLYTVASDYFDIKYGKPGKNNQFEHVEKNDLETIAKYAALNILRTK